jgi:hypothetical protein
MSPQDAAARFFARLRASLDDSSFVELRLRPAEGVPTDVRAAEIGGRPSLSFVAHEPRQDVTKNDAIEPGLKRVAEFLQTPGSAWLATTGKSWQLVIPPGKPARLVPHKVKRDAAQPAHDRAKKKHLGDSGRDWLVALGLVDKSGRPRTGRTDKLRQIERYTDLLSHFASDCGWRRGQTIALADMGCGKGYLTFAAWHLLRRELGMEAEVTGIDQQPALIDACVRLAASLPAEGLRFRTGSIRDAALAPLDGLIALHACNDATDHAIRRGLEAGAQLIVVAPCCHKDVRRVLGDPVPLAPLLSHGLFKEHFAEWLTDGLRALALEAAGYRVKVAEFVSPEHTPKNTLIAAIKGNSAARREQAAREVAAIKAWADLGAWTTHPGRGGGVPPRREGAM